MKTLSLVLLLMASMAFVMSGCSDNSATPVSPADQSVPASLGKAIITDFTVTKHFPVGLTGEGDVKLVPGGKWQLKNLGVIEQVLASDPLASGIMKHYLSATMDAITGEGPVNGSFVMTPAGDAAGGGVWEGTYQGYRSKSTGIYFTLPLKVVGHGKGGTIDGMQFFEETVITAWGTPPEGWWGTGTGFYKSH
jgi:hypothetical protein